MKGRNQTLTVLAIIIIWYVLIGIVAISIPPFRTLVERRPAGDGAPQATPLPSTTPPPRPIGTPLPATPLPRTTRTPSATPPPRPEGTSLPTPLPSTTPTPVPSSSMPKFPWPPPAASASLTIPLRDLITLNRFNTTTGYSAERLSRMLQERGPLVMHANALLQSALHNTGQYETGYYEVPDGFALVSRLEQIEKDGTPKPSPERYSTEVRHMESFSFSAYIRALFVAPPGLYRLIVFVVTPHPFAQSQQRMSKDRAEQLLRQGNNVLPMELDLQPYTDRHVCTALIYEFEKFDTQDQAPIVRLPGRLSAETHLEKSGVGRYFR